MLSKRHRWHHHASIPPPVRIRIPSHRLISFTALVINELIMVALEITTWHTYMVLSELGTALVYFGSMAVLPAYFGE